jgi:hypothetical protein
VGAADKDQRPAALDPDEIIATLQAGPWSLLDLIIADPRLHGPSRLALWMERVSRDSGRFYQRPDRLAVILNAGIHIVYEDQEAPDLDEVDDSQTQVDKWLAQVRRWKLFRKDGDSYRPRRLTKAEQADAKAFSDRLSDKLDHKVDIDAFKLVVQRRINPLVAVLSVIRDLTEYVDDDGKVAPRPVPAPHTNPQFVDQLQRHPKTIAWSLNQAVDLGYTIRTGGTGGGRRGAAMRVRKSTWYRPDAGIYLLADDIERDSERGSQRLHKATHERRAKNQQDDVADQGQPVDVDSHETGVTKPIRRLSRPVTKPVRPPGWDDDDE